MSSGVTYSTFISNWKTILDESREIQFIPDIFNMIDYLIEDNVVQKNGKYREYEREVIKRAVDILKDDDDITTRLIKEIDSPSVTKLVELVQGGSFDREVHKLLKALKVNLTGAKYIRASGKLIRDSVKRSHVETFVLLSNLIRYLLSIYSYKYLEQIPKISFSRTFFLPFENSLLMDDTKNSEVLAEIEHFWKEYLGIAIDGSKKLQASIDTSLDSLFRNSYWLRDRITLLRILKQNIITKSKSTNTLDINQYVFSLDGGRQIICECARIICINLLREFLGESYPGSTNINAMNELYRQRYFKTLSSKIVDEIYPEEWDRKRSTFEHTLLDEAISTFLKTLSENVVSRLKEIIEKQENKFELIFAQIAKRNSEPNEDNAKALDMFDFSLSFFQFLEEMTLDLVKDVSNELITIKEQQALDSSEFLKYQIGSLIKYFSTRGYLNLPSRLTFQDLDRFLDELFCALSNPEKEWDVFLEIGNVDLNGEIITFDNVTLFDARKWHKGESIEWDQRSEQDKKFKSKYLEYGFGFARRLGSNERIKIPFKRNSAMAKIRVGAHEPDIALFKAKNSLKKLFSTMVFEFSEANRENYQPQVSNRFQVMSVNGKEGTYGENFDTSRILEVTAKEKNILDWYAESTSASHRANRLNRALSWFNAAFWEEEFHAKYALYWIGLEQLLDMDAEDNKKEGDRKVLLRIIPKITVSWRDYRHANFVIGNHLREIAGKLLKKPDLIDLINKQDALRDWAKRDYVMLENLSLLEQLANDPDISGSIYRLQKWIQDNTNDITTFLNERRVLVEFRAAYLYARRNSIVHDGITDFSNMEFFVSGLQNLLKKIISVSLIFPSERTWDAISEQFNRPFTVSPKETNV